MLFRNVLLWRTRPEDETPLVVGEDNPLDVVVRGPLPALSKTFLTEWYTVPGVVPAVAYASGDAMGTRFSVDMRCKSGLVYAVYVADLDKEQAPFDVVFYRNRITPTADNAAMDLADEERFLYAGHVSVAASDYAAMNDNAFARSRDTALPFECPSGFLEVQLITRGVPNYTTALDLAIALGVLPDLS